MTADDAPPGDRFLAEMAELDEALAAGLPDTSRVGDCDPALDARRERDRACLERLHRLRPGHRPAPDLTARGSLGPAVESIDPAARRGRRDTFRRIRGRARRIPAPRVLGD